MTNEAFKITYTADDEEPRCERCDNQIKSDEWCCENCGPKYWWCGYKRTEDLFQEKGVLESE